MEKQTISTGDTPNIRIEMVEGDLRLKGHDESQVVGKAESTEDLAMEVLDDGVNIRCQSDLALRVPRAAAVHIVAAQGDAEVKGLDGSLEIETVDGNLSLRGVADTQVGQVSGELHAKNVAGHLHLENVGGNASVRDVQGDFTVSGGVSGNLSVNDVDNDINARSGGNINLSLDPAPGQTYVLEAAGNIFCRLADEVSAVVEITSANKIVVNLPGIESSAPQAAPACYTLGEGDASLSLSAGGNVVLDSHMRDWSMLGDFDFDFDFEGVDQIAKTLDEQIGQQVEAQLRMVQEQMDAQMATLTARLSASGLSEEQARRVEERARQASERASVRAQERMRRAQERLEQKLASAQRKVEHKARAAARAEASVHRHGRPHIFGMRVPTPPPPPGDPISEEERLAILRMLEQKKITMEQAEQLLSALEGKGG